MNDAQPDSGGGLWQPCAIGLGAPMRACVGPLAIWARRQGDELHLAFVRDANSNIIRAEPWARADAENAPADWSRFVVGKSHETIRLAPAMPNLSVVVRPEAPVDLPPGREAVFFVSIPIWVRVLSGDDTELAIEHTSWASKTWFGDPMSGELCYSLTTSARRDAATLSHRPHRAVCPMTIRNAADIKLDLSRLPVVTRHLRIYQGRQHLWTSPAEMIFSGADQPSQVRYPETEPTYEPIESLIASARSPARQTLLKRTFGGIKLFGI